MRHLGSAVIVALVPLLGVGGNDAQALVPPIRHSDEALEHAWEVSASALDECSAKAMAGARAGTIWIDVLFPSKGKPTWKLRKSPQLTAADASCIHSVVSKHVLPALAGTYRAVEEPITTKELSLGGAPRFLPPLASFLPAWFDLLRSPSDASRRARLQARVKPLASVTRDSCLLVHREERLQPARKVWLAAAGREALQVWQPIVDRLSKAVNIMEPVLFVLDGGLLFAGARTDTSVAYQMQWEGRTRRVQPDEWSRQWETYCLRRTEDRVRAEIDRGIDDIAACVASTGATERLVEPRIESPADRKLRSVSLADRRYCGIDQTGTVVCCGVRSGVAPQGAFSAVSVDEQYGCALRPSGEIACWGNPPLGAQPPEGRFTKVQVAGGACAITDRRNIRCWGLPDAWQPPPGEFVDVAVAYTSAYAVAADGTLVEWGQRSNRRAANAARVAATNCQACVTTRTGAADCRDEKGREAHFAGPVTAFSPGCSGGCGLRSDGTIACTPETQGAPPPALAKERFSEITSIRDRFCATTVQGRVACWGAPWPGNWLGRRSMTGGQP
jgi:hypothetical protein